MEYKVFNFNQLEHFLAKLKIWLSQGSAGSIPVRGTWMIINELR